MDQPTLSGLPERLFAVSPAKLDTWRDCPRRYRWQYLDRSGVTPRNFARTLMGNAAHLALRLWWAERPADPEDVLNVIDRTWDDDLFRDLEQSSRARDLVRGWVRTYLDKHSDRDDPSITVRGVERTVSTTTEHLTISGRIDRIDERAGEIVVVDYKTGRGELTDDDARTSMTLAIYADAIRRSLRHECHQVELHHLPTGTVASHRHTPEGLARHLGRADAIGVELRDAVRAHAENPGDADQNFPARTGGLCGWCDFWSICPEGQAASTQRETWAGVDDPDHTGSAGGVGQPV